MERRRRSRPGVKLAVRKFMQAQFQYLIEVSDLPNVTFQEIPFDAGAPGHAGLFMSL